MSTNTSGWLRYHYSALRGELPDETEKWSWPDTGIPRSEYYQLTDRGLLAEVENSSPKVWQTKPKLAEKLREEAKRRGDDPEEVFANASEPATVPAD